MTKFEIIIQKLATLEEQNKGQNSKIDNIEKNINTHAQESTAFRETCTKNRINIIWLRLAILGILGWIGSTFLGK